MKSSTQTKSAFHRVLGLGVAALVVLSVGCSSGHSVRYPVRKADKWAGAPVGGVLRVMPLEDQAVATTDKSFHEGGYLYRQNSRGRYKKQELSQNTTKMVIEHLRKSGLFTDVVGQNSPKPATMELTGVMADYHCKGRANKGAEGTHMAFTMAGIVFMPIGLLVGPAIGMGVTAGAKSEIDAGVMLKDMTLRPVGSTNVLWQGSVNVQTNYVGHWSNATDMGILMNADLCLRSGVTDMIQQIGTTLQKSTAKAE